MGVAETRKQIKARIDRLPPESLRSAEDFLAYLQERGSSAPSADNTLIRFRRRIAKAESEAALGKLTPVNALRRKR
jgi:hypothetical protein